MPPPNVAIVVWIDPTESKREPNRSVNVAKVEVTDPTNGMECVLKMLPMQKLKFSDVFVPVGPNQPAIGNTHG